MENCQELSKKFLTCVFAGLDKAVEANSELRNDLQVFTAIRTIMGIDIMTPLQQQFQADPQTFLDSFYEQGIRNSILKPNISSKQLEDIDNEVRKSYQIYLSNCPITS